jgi:hypothetical protein
MDRPQADIAVVIDTKWPSCSWYPPRIHIRWLKSGGKVWKWAKELKKVTK